MYSVLHVGYVGVQVLICNLRLPREQLMLSVT